MKKSNVSFGAMIIFRIIAVLFISGVFISCASNNETEIKLAARRASVQVSTYLPVIKVSFTSPLSEKEKFTKKTLNDAIEEAKAELVKTLQEKIRSEIEKDNQPKHETSLTNIETYGFLPKSKTEIPIGSLPGVPEYAAYPQKVLIVYKTEKTDIEPWKKEAEEDVLAISEVAGVSISKAQEMLSRIQSKGYTVSKEDVAEDTEITLLWFSDWDDAYPTTLKWEVKIEGVDTNILTGYDSRGILQTKPIPDKKRVYVSAGYFDLKDEFKPKSPEVIRLENQIKSLEEDRDNLEKTIKDAVPEIPPYKRDIRNVTWMDIRLGVVKMEIFYVSSAASGVYLGNAQVSDKFKGWAWRKGRDIEKPIGSFVLTNAHVARQSMQSKLWTSEDNEVMFLVGPGIPFIRYTQHSDSFGSPANILFMDSQPVYSIDYDCAVLVTTAIPGYEKNAAKLGDSDKVKDGTKIVMTGNPMNFQKFSTEGIISNADYPTINAYLDKAGAFKRNMGQHRLLKPTMWIDAPIGAGGTSGSGVWALEGPEAGKVVSLHNSEMVTGVLVSEMKEENYYGGSSKYVEPDLGFYSEGLIKEITQEQKEQIFANYSYRDVVFSKDYATIEKKTPDDPFIVMMEDTYYVMMAMTGMNAGIPINDVKTYLQERGLDPGVFEFKGVDRDYWVK